ncbi:MAG: hypothetical protein SGJ27_10595 [Candidatus Melainabacteria bacterium]|nr:hypothetical protein [Candidatus Melainabacteria bacterium]
MRISGLVGASTRVRSLLQTGIRPEKMEDFRKSVRSMIQQIDTLCATHGIDPDDLPTPSKNAVRYLKSINLEQLPINTSARETPKIKKAQVKNVVASANRFSSEMWHTLDELLESESAFSDLRFGIECTVDGIDFVCKEQGSGINGMAEQSRQAFAWMKFLLEDDNLRMHINALRMGRNAALEQGLSVEIHLVNTPKSLYRSSDHTDHLLLKAHEGFIHADQKVWFHFIKLFKDDTNSSKPIVLKFASEPAFSQTCRTFISIMCGCQERQAVTSPGMTFETPRNNVVDLFARKS